MNDTVKTYLIRSVSSGPDRDAVPLLEADRILWLPDCGVRAFGQFCYDPAYLYVRLRAVEKNIRAGYTAPLSPVHQDSCLEFFFMQEGDNCYFNFEINPNGCLHIGYGSGRQNRSVVSPTGPDPFGIRTEKTPDGWTASYRIPLSFLRLFRPDFAFAGWSFCASFALPSVPRRDGFSACRSVFLASYFSASSNTLSLPS